MIISNRLKVFIQRKGLIRIEDSEDKGYYKEEIKISKEEGNRNRVSRIII